MRRLASALAALGLALGALLLLVPTASAHERRQIGPYILVVGFLHEPAYVEELNGASLTVFRTDGQPVEGLEKTLKVEVSAGGASRTFDLKPEPGRPGAYKAEFIPTRTGGYVFRFFGKIETTEVNERFESGPNRFDEVVSKAELQFPTSVPSNAELAQRLGAAAATPVTGAAARAPEVAARSSEDNTARGRANAALAVGVAGLLCGALGVALGVYGLVAGRRVARVRAAEQRGEPV